MSKTLIISHAHSIGGQFADHYFWMGVIEGAGMNWKVLRQHKDGTISIIEQSKKDKND